MLLNAIRGVPAKAVRDLADVGIKTAEQLVGVSVTSGGMDLLAHQLDLPREKVVVIVKLSKRSLPKEMQRNLAKPVDTRKRPLGAMR